MHHNLWLWGDDGVFIYTCGHHSTSVWFSLEGWTREQLILTRWLFTTVAAAHVTYAHCAFIQRLSQSGSELDWQLFQGASICYCVSWIHLHLSPQAAVAQAISDSRLSIKTLRHGSWCINFVIVCSCDVWVSSGEVVGCRKRGRAGCIPIYFPPFFTEPL